MLRYFKNNEKTYTDEQLVRLYRESGDLKHLATLYDRYLELVYGVCLKYFKNSARAEDAAMAIFEELIDKLQRHDVHHFKPWLHTLVRNHCLMVLRKKQPYQVSLDELPAAGLARLVQSAQSMHPASANGDHHFEPLKDCIEKLPPLQRTCVLDFYFGGNSYKEIAEEYNLPLGMVRSHIQNGRRNLRICLEKKGISHMTQLKNSE